MNADYKCYICNTITNYVKPYGEDFPKEILCLKINCKKKAQRIFSAIKFDIAKGNTGITYHSSPYTPKRKARKSLYLPDRD